MTHARKKAMHDFGHPVEWTTVKLPQIKVSTWLNIEWSKGAQKTDTSMMEKEFTEWQQPQHLKPWKSYTRPTTKNQYTNIHRVPIYARFLNSNGSLYREHSATFQNGEWCELGKVLSLCLLSLWSTGTVIQFTIGALYITEKGWSVPYWMPSGRPLNKANIF